MSKGPTVHAAPISKLVLDFSFYPRHSISDFNVAGLADVIRDGRGGDLPPVIVWSKNQKVIDGFNRVTACRRVLGEEGVIAVEYRDYKNEADAFLDAVRSNATHGMKLNPYDMARCVSLSADFGCQKFIAEALQLSHDRYEKLVARKFAEHKGKQVPIKMTLRHLAGTKLSKDQIAGNKGASGMPVLFHVRQVILAIKNDLVDETNETLAEAMQELAKLLADRVVA